MQRPPKADSLSALAEEHNWSLDESFEKVPLTLAYDDGSEREVQTDMFKLVGLKGDAGFLVGWYLNPWSERWKLIEKRLILVTATDVEKQLADALDLLPRYVYWDQVSFKTFERVIAHPTAEYLLREWNNS